MKHWLHRWRIARSMDEGGRLPSSTVEKLRTDPELGRHRDVLTMLERDLREEAREWHARQTPLERVPFAELAPAARRPRRLAPRLLVATAAAAIVIVTAVLLMRAPATGDPAPGSTAPAVAVETAAPWASLDRFAQRVGTLSLSGFRWARREVLVGEVRNVARDARRLADVLVDRVSFTGRRSG